MTGSRVFGHDIVVQAFADKAATVGPRAFEITRRYGLMAQTKIRANMSGRTGVTFMPEGQEDAGPAGEIGPRAVTGDLRRSVTTETSIDGVTVRSTTGSNEPQALRLELGFVGVDALGRHYDQPPYPAWRPAYDALSPAYRRDIDLLAAL